MLGQIEGSYRRLPQYSIRHARRHSASLRFRIMTTHHPNRRSIHVAAYDHFQAGACVVTIVAEGHACLLDEVVDGEIRWNNPGGKGGTCWVKWIANCRAFEP